MYIVKKGSANMTNLEYIEKNATCNDMACIYAQVFGCKNEKTLTPFCREVNAAMAMFLLSHKDYGTKDFNETRHVNIFLSLQYDKNQWNFWFKEYYNNRNNYPWEIREID